MKTILAAGLLCTLTATAFSGETPYAQTLQETKTNYLIKMVLGSIAADRLATNLKEAATRSAAKDLKAAKAVDMAMEKLQKDPEFQAAIGNKGDANWKTIEKIYKEDPDMMRINLIISNAAQTPAATVLELTEKYLRENLNSAGIPHPEEILEATMVAAVPVEITDFR